MLPSASAAHGEVFAWRRDAYFARLSHGNDAPLGVRFLFLFYFYVDTVAGSTERYEYDHVIDSCQGVSFGCDIAYLYILKDGQGFFLS